MDESGRELSAVPDGTWVLRGGDLANVSREKNLRAVHEAFGLWGICACVEPGKSPDELARYGHFGNRLMMTALSDELRAAGFAVVREPARDWPSALIVISSSEPVGDDWERLRVCMMRRGLTANPSYRGK